VSQLDGRGSIEEPCLSIVKLNGELVEGSGFCGIQGDNGMDGGDGKRGWLGY